MITNIKKIITISTLLSLFALFGFTLVSQPVFADAATNSTVFKACDNNSTTKFCQGVSSKSGSFELIGKNGAITKIAQIIVWLVGIVSVLMIVIGGFRYVISGGDSSGVNGAKNSIIYACVGLAIAIFAQVIVSFVISNL